MKDDERTKISERPGMDLRPSSLVPRPSLCLDTQRLLHYLRSYCPRRALAHTDAHIAEALSLCERIIIDLADDLLQHGHLAIAEVGRPSGRWILEDADLRPAYDYLQQLRLRGVRILRRRKHLRVALAAAEARRRIESNGQMRMDFTAESAEFAERKLS